MKTARRVLCLQFLLTACASSSPPAPGIQPHLGIRWVRDSAEYVAIAKQTYRAARLALPEMVADKDWSALPEQQHASHLPPAVILDVDETSLTNPLFQAQLEPPFTDSKLNEWSIAHLATPVPGAVAFANEAVSHGVTLFFITNRPCMPEPDNNDSCPQKAIVVQDLVEAGLPATQEYVSLSGERPDWGSEKKTRRDWIAESYRVIQLIGDDLSDFIPCVRRRPVEPCSESGSIAGRYAAAEAYEKYWGNGWYILPNPMHGSWTSVH